MNIKKISKYILSLSLIFCLKANANQYEKVKNILLKNEMVPAFVQQNKDYDFFNFDEDNEKNITCEDFYKYLKNEFTKINKIKPQNPICSLLECDEDDCILSRTNSNVRLFYENKIIEYLKKHFHSKTQNIVITDFGSGALLQNLIIITKILNEGYTNLTICLIDKEYDLNIIHENNPTYINWLTIYKKFHEINNIHLTKFLFEQYRNFLNINFPEVKIEMQIFDSMDNYINNVLKKSTLKTDIFLSIDTIDISYLENPEDPKEIADIQKILLDLRYFKNSCALKPGGLAFLCNKIPTTSNANFKIIQKKSNLSLDYLTLSPNKYNMLKNYFFY